MTERYSNKNDELRGIVRQRLTAFIREMEDADWNAEDVAAAVGDIIRTEWLAKSEEHQRARDAMSGNLISDGNEG